MADSDIVLASSPGKPGEETLAFGRRPGWSRAWIRESVGRWGRATRFVVVVPGWVGATVLTALAPFRPLVRAGAPRHGARRFTLLDGWGRAPAGIVAVLRHGARFGIALEAAAGCLAMLTIVGAVTLIRRGTAASRLGRATTAFAIGAPCVLAGVTGSLLLYTDAYLSQVHRILHQRGPVTTNTEWGSGTWLALIALACAILGSCMYFLTRAQTSPSSEPTEAS